MLTNDRESFQAVGYRPEVDGLRALAVLVVTLYHFDVTGFEGGYVGVDVFFVISGYLITGIILSELYSGNFTLRSFYQRRIRRIFPALFFVTLITIPPALVLLVPRDLEDFGQSVISIGFFIQNFLFHAEAGYFGGPSELKPLLHTWSLAVEEQFYLLFPFVCLLAFKYRISFVWFFSLLFAASLIYAEWQVRRDASTAFYLLPARWWELMLGSLVAILARDAELLVSGKIRSTAVALIGLFMVVACLLFFDETTQFPGWSALLPCVGTALLILGLRDHNFLQRFFALKPIVFFGLISYSLYLWHFPIAAFAKRLLGRDFLWSEQLALILLSVGLAGFSWRYIEQPFRGSRSPISSTQLKWFAIGCVMSVTAFGLYTDLADGAWDRFDEETQVILRAFDYRDRACIGKENCLLRAGEPTYAVWGDSHADAMLGAFRQLSEDYGVNTEGFIFGGCLPVVGYQPGTSGFADRCRAFNERTLGVLKTSPHQTVFLHGRWTLAVEQSKFKYEKDAALPVMAYPENPTQSAAQIVEASLRQTLDELANSGKEIIVLGPVPEAGWNVPYALAQRVRFGDWFEQRAANPSWQEFSDRNRASLEILRRVVSDYENVTLLEPHKLFCTEARGCEIEIDNVPLYADSHHLSPRGSELLYPLLEPIYRTEK